MNRRIPFLLLLISNLNILNAFCVLGKKSTLAVCSSSSASRTKPSQYGDLFNLETSCSRNGLCWRLTKNQKVRSTVTLNAAFVPTGPEILGALNAFYKTKPLASAFVTCALKASAADIVAQTAEDSDQSNISKRRNIAFFMYGGLYQGLAQEMIFNKIFPALFGEGSAISVINKVVFNSIVVGPFITLPSAYLVKSLIFNHSIVEAIATYKNDIVQHGLLKKFWSIWVPVQFLTFGVVPKHFRILFIAAVSFFWLVIFSSITAKS